jgi:hypothetical protein
LAGLAVAILLFISIAVYGNVVAQGVVEEKSTRIIEVLLATVRPTDLLAGKISGIGFVGLLQLGLVGAAALVAASLTHAVSIPAVGVTQVALYLAWFLVGFALYASAYGRPGHLVCADVLRVAGSDGAPEHRALPPATFGADLHADADRGGGRSALAGGPRDGADGRGHRGRGVGCRTRLRQRSHAHGRSRTAPGRVPRVACSPSAGISEWGLGGRLIRSTRSRRIVVMDRMTPA